MHARNKSSNGDVIVRSPPASPFVSHLASRENVASSARNRSPYVADVRLTSGEHAGRTAVVHAPSLDMGGKFLPGTRVLCRRQPGVTPDTLGKHGTPKCELITQLMWLDGGDEDEGSKGVWIGAHPALGEKLAAALLALVSPSADETTPCNDFLSQIQTGNSQ